MVDGLQQERNREARATEQVPDINGQSSLNSLDVLKSKPATTILLKQGEQGELFSGTANWRKDLGGIELEMESRQCNGVIVQGRDIVYPADKERFARLLAHIKESASNFTAGKKVVLQPWKETRPTCQISKASQSLFTEPIQNPQTDKPIMRADIGDGSGNDSTGNNVKAVDLTDLTDKSKAPAAVSAPPPQPPPFGAGNDPKIGSADSPLVHNFKADDQFAQKMQDSVDNWPLIGVRHLIRDRENKSAKTFPGLIAVHSVCAYDTVLCPTQPRGWEPGSTFKNATGYSEPNLAVVAQWSLYGGKWGQPVVLEGILSHEAGHLADYLMQTTGVGIPFSSTDADFQKAYAADTQAASPQDKQQFAYYFQAGMAGPQEAFAQLHAIREGTVLDKTQAQDMLRIFPKTNQAEEKALLQLEPPGSPNLKPITAPTI